MLIGSNSLGARRRTRRVAQGTSSAMAASEAQLSGAFPAPNTPARTLFALSAARQANFSVAPTLETACCQASFAQITS